MGDIVQSGRYSKECLKQILGVRLGCRDSGIGLEHVRISICCDRSFCSNEDV